MSDVPPPERAHDLCPPFYQAKRSISLTPLANGSLQIAGLTTPRHLNETTPEFLAAEALNDSVVVSQTCIRAMAVQAWGTKDRAREDVSEYFVDRSSTSSVD